MTSIVKQVTPALVQMGANAAGASAAAASGLNNDRISNGFGNTTNLHWIIRQLTFRTGYTRHTGLDHGLFGRHLVTHQADGFGCGANELKTFES